jgi:hypothetical protein
VQVELQDPIGACVAYLAVCLDCRKLVVALTSRANHKLPYAVCSIEFPARVLLCETLVVVIVAVEDHICVILVECVPYRSSPAKVVAMLAPLLKRGWCQ